MAAPRGRGQFREETPQRARSGSPGRGAGERVETFESRVWFRAPSPTAPAHDFRAPPQPARTSTSPDARSLAAGADAGWTVQAPPPGPFSRRPLGPALRLDIGINRELV